VTTIPRPSPTLPPRVTPFVCRSVCLSHKWALDSREGVEPFGHLREGRVRGSARGGAGGPRPAPIVTLRDGTPAAEQEALFLEANGTHGATWGHARAPTPFPENPKVVELPCQSSLSQSSIHHQVLTTEPIKWPASFCLRMGAILVMAAFSPFIWS